MSRQQLIWNVAVGFIGATTILSWPFSATAEEIEKEIINVFQVSAETELEIENGVGTIAFERVEGDEVIITLQAKRSKKNSFFSFSNPEKSLEELEIEVEQDGNLISIEASEADNLQLNWTVKMPLVARLDVELGVGEISGEIDTTDMNIELGIGAVDLELYGDYRLIEMDVGVGATEIRGARNVNNNRMMVTSNSSSESEGTAKVNVEVGVGDISITIKD